MINPQFITNLKGEKKSVVLPVKDFKKLIEAYEELEDIRLYDKVKKKNEKRIPLDEYMRLRQKRSNG
ncbi:MAG TPA: hypothetical protein VF622_09055 [Segetibacter sp.]|jgi:hypothetical protein